MRAHVLKKSVLLSVILFSLLMIQSYFPMYYMEIFLWVGGVAVISVTDTKSGKPHDVRKTRKIKLFCH